MRAIRLCAVVLCSAVGVIASTGPAGAAPTPTTLQFGAPVGSSCSEVDASFGQVVPSSSPVTLIPDGLPLDGWNGVLILGLLEGRDALGASGGLLNPNCGDLAHGSTDMGIGASASNTYSNTAAGVLSMSASLNLAPTNLLTALLGEDAMIEGEQIQSSTLTPVVAPGDQSFTISVNYTVLSSSLSTPIASFAGAGLTFISDAQAPSCAGQNILDEQSGTLSADHPGTYTASFEFSCPIGEALTASGPIQVQFAETQSGVRTATSTAQSYSASISAQVNSATVTYG
jgi:hypothetical protein